MNKIKYLSVCSGMEAATVAWHHMGWTPVGFSEIEPFPSQILKHHYPTIPNYGDLTKFKEWPIQRGAVDLLVGGTPCQAFSVAGLRKGLDDPRGNLALTFLALADHLRPKYILWENVPGVLSSSGGRDFGSFIGALAQLGYGFAWRVCDAQYFGVPQRRKRVFLLAIEGAGNWRTAAEILFERKSLCGDIEESDKEGEGVASDAGTGVETGSYIWSASDQPNAERLIDKAGTLNCNQGQRGGYIVPNVVGSLCARDFKGVGNQYVQEGKCIVEGDPSPTLTKGFVPGVAQIPQGVDLYNQALTGDLHCPLRTAGAHHAPAVMAFDAFNQTVSETSQTLSCSASDVNHTGAVYSPTMAVRRLTPVECERLQGFPDNYSQIPWKGKPASECPDGPRYKACGNSMAVPVMRFIGERIQKQIDGTLPK